MRRLSERGVWVAGAGVVLVVLVVARIDFVHTESKIPPIPAPCATDSIECNNARNAKFGPRLDEIRRLDHDFDRRAWIYGGLATLAFGLAAVGALVRSPTLAEQRRVFADTGVAGVLLGLAGVFVYWLSGREISPPAGAIFVPCITLLAIAGLGGGAARVQSPPPEETAMPQAPTEGRMKPVALVALGCTALTVILAWAYAGAQDGSCDVQSQAPAWTTPVAWAAVVTAVAAGLLALAGLAGRRWFVALVCFLVNPAALIYMVLSTGALC
jgi:hypothetical protein